MIIDAKIVKWLTVFTGLLVVTSTVGDIFAGLRYMATTNAVSAQERDNRERRREYREKERAVIAIADSYYVPPQNFDAPDAVFMVIPTYQNYGPTRTSRFTATADLRYFDGGIPEKYDLSKPAQKVPAEDIVVAPYGKYQGIQLLIPIDDLKKASEAKGVVLFWTNVEYADIFEPEKKHHVSNCTLFVVRTGRDGKPSITNLAYKPECNRSD